MKTAKTTSKITFRVQKGEGSMSKDSLLDGYLNQFSERPVLHQYRLKTIVAKKTELATTVLSFYASKDYVDTWADIKSLKTVQTMNAYLKPMNLQAVDVFRVQFPTPTSISGLIRVTATSVRKFMMHEDINISFSIVGDNGKNFKMIWDSDLSNVMEARTRYKHVPGFAGVAQTTRGIGIRVEATSYEVAAKMLGKPVGNVYKLAGVPLHLGLSEVEDIVDEIGWDAAVIPNGRRAFKGAASWLLRSPHEPPEVAISMTFDSGELARMQITEFTKQAKAKDASTSSPAPSTWAEVAKRTLGVTRPSDQPQPAFNWNEQDSVQMSQDEESHDEEEEDEDEDDDEEQHDLQHGSDNTMNQQPGRHLDDGTQPEDDDDDMCPLNALLHSDGGEHRKRPAENQVGRSAGRTKRTRPMDDARVDKLENSITAMQQQMEQFMTMMRMQMAPPMPTEHPTRCLQPSGAFHGQMPMKQPLKDLFSWEDVPTDGSCMWQSACLLEKDWPQGHTPQQGYDYKKQKLDIMHAQVNQLAAVWQCEAAGVQNALKAWTPKRAWADIRAHLSLAYVADTVVVIQDDVKDALCFICPTGQWSPQSTFWYFRYGDEHCSPGRCNDFQSLVASLEQIPLQPWNPNSTEFKQRGADGHLGPTRVSHLASPVQCNIPGSTYMRPLGGMKLTPSDWVDDDLDDASTTASGPAPTEHDPDESATQHEDEHPIEHDPIDEENFDEDFEFLCIPSNQSHEVVSSGPQVHVYSSNINGWRSGGKLVLSSICDDDPFVLCMQEVALTGDGQFGLRSALKEKNLQCVFGQASPWKRSRRGAIRIDKGSVPGVAIVASDKVSLLPIGFQTDAANRWYRCGRCMLVQIGLGDASFLILNIYAPSGANAKKARNEFLADMSAEIALWTHTRMSVCGDFNTPPFNTSLVGEAMIRQWQLPVFRTPDQHLVTYHSGESRSWLDAFVVSPELASSVYYQDVKWCGKLQHAVLHIAICVDLLQPCPRVQHAPVVTAGPNTNASPVDWTVVLHDIKTLHTNYQNADGMASQQMLVDDVWSVFLCAYERELRSCHEVHDCEGRKGAFVLGGEQTFRPSSVVHQPEQDPISQLHMFDLLVSDYQQEESKCNRHKIAEIIPAVADVLKLSVAVAWDIADGGPDGLQRVRKAIRRIENGMKRKGLREWRNRFEDDRHRPSKSLFRWLKGRRVHSHLAVSTDKGIALGYDAFFGSLTAYWKEIMCEEPVGDTCALHEWLTAHAEGLPVLDADAELLLKVANDLSSGRASGMDGWSNEALKCMSPEAARVLVYVYQLIETVKCWPSSLLKVRTQMIPKDDTPTPTLDGLRPISIMSVWYRLWGKFRLTSVDQSVYNNLDDGLCGGLPGRQSNAKMCNLLAAVEKAIDGGGTDPIFILSLDASKCFDRITHVSVLEAARECMIPVQLLGALAGFYSGVERYMSASGYISSDCFHPTNGIPQGCCFSALITNCLVHQWCQEMRNVGANPQSFLDDRTIVTSSLESLQEAAAISHKWDCKNRWRLNVKKCAMLPAPFDSHAFITIGGKPVATKGAIKLLGTNLCTSYLGGRDIQKKRTSSACATAE
eukprot:6466790-Amphidinium_carterae.1